MSKQLSDTDRERIQEHLNLGVDELYSLLPPYDPEFDRTYFMLRGQIDAGKRIFQKLHDNVSRTLCDDWELCKRINDINAMDSVTLVATIADVISTSCGTIPPFAIATLTVKLGLRKFCNCSAKE